MTEEITNYIDQNHKETAYQICIMQLKRNQKQIMCP